MTILQLRSGGNQGFAGWRVLGYPGPHHTLGGYTAAQMAGRAPVESAWGEALPRKRERAPR